MTASPKKFSKLSIEWRNKGVTDFVHKERLVSMKRLAARVAEIQASESYVDTWLSLMLDQHERHAHNEEYVARILVLLDHRPVSINPLQLSIGFQIGHLFRTLNERAGVVFRGHTSTIRSRIREDYFPWPLQVFIDPESRRMIFGDQALDIPDDVEIFKKDEKRPLRRDGEPEEDQDGFLSDAADAFDVDDEVLGLLHVDTEVVPLPLHHRMRSPAGPPIYKPVRGRT